MSKEITDKLKEQIEKVLDELQFYYDDYDDPRDTIRLADVFTDQLLTLIEEECNKARVEELEGLYETEGESLEDWAAWIDINIRQRISELKQDNK